MIDLDKSNKLAVLTRMDTNMSCREPGRDIAEVDPCPRYVCLIVLLIP